MGRPDSFRRKRQCLPAADPPVLRTQTRRFRTDLLHAGLHREIPLFRQSGRKQTKFGFFTTETNDYRKIAEELGIRCLSREGEPLRYARHPLVYLVEAADDICYQMMDLEDAHKLKILTTDETKALYAAFFSAERLKHIQETCRLVSDTNEQIAYLRSSAIGVLVKECTRIFVENERQILEGTFEGPLIRQMASPAKEAYEACSRTAFAKIYCSKDVVDIELAGYRVITTLIDLMIDAVRFPEKAYSQLLINRISTQYDIHAPSLFGKYRPYSTIFPA